MKKNPKPVPLFTARHIDGRTPITGYYVQWPDGTASIYSPDKWDSYPVKPETVRLANVKTKKI